MSPLSARPQSSRTLQLRMPLAYLDFKLSRRAHVVSRPLLPFSRER